MKKAVELDVNGRLDISAAEKLLSKLEGQSLSIGNTVVDFRRCTQVEIGAGYRLGNALRIAAEAGKLTVLVAPNEFSDSPSREWFLRYTRSGIGPAIAAHAHIILSGREDIKKKVAAYYERTLEAPSQNSVFFSGLHSGRLDVEDESRFTRTFLDQFRFLNVSPRSFDEQALTCLVGMCFEAAQNTVDHAAKKPLAPSTNIFSYLSLRYYKGTERPDEGAFSGYLKRVLKEFGASSGVRFLEIVVNDDGVGIPARESQTLDIYSGPPAKEREALTKALTHSTVKLAAKDSQIRGGVTGQGYRRIRESLKQLRAFASLRTGRCFASLDGLSPIQTSFQLLPSSHGTVFSRMPGTALQVVIPFVPKGAKEGQQSLF